MPTSYSGTAITWPDNSTTTSGWTGFKNRIINGQMVLDQRNSGASVSTSSGLNVYTLDRWRALYSQTSKFTVQQNAGSVTPPNGFSNYLGVTSSSAYTVGASEAFRIAQYIEGFNFADMMWGTANAQPVTLSFWVRSSLTGTFGGVLTNATSTRSYPYSYTISAANTWEYKTITVAGDTTGTWVGATNGRGVELGFSLGSGSSVSTTANAWAAGEFHAPTGATSVVGTNGATFYITGVQLERGSTASSFEYRDYGRELIMCQRYYEVQNLEYQLALYDSAETKFRWGRRPYAVVKRTTPSSAIKSGTIYYAVPGSNGYSADSNANITWYSLTDSFAAAQLRAAGRATPTGGNMYMIEGGIVAEFSAEL